MTSGELPEHVGDQCSRCGSTATWEYCTNCDHGMAYHDCGEDTCCCAEPEDNVPCDICDGKGGWGICLSGPGWCEAHPLPGRADVPRGGIEEVVACC